MMIQCPTKYRKLGTFVRSKVDAGSFSRCAKIHTKNENEKMKVIKEEKRGKMEKEKKGRKEGRKEGGNVGKKEGM